MWAALSTNRTRWAPWIALSCPTGLTKRRPGATMAFNWALRMGWVHGSTEGILTGLGAEFLGFPGCILAPHGAPQKIVGANQGTMPAPWGTMGHIEATMRAPLGKPQGSGNIYIYIQTPDQPPKRRRASNEGFYNPKLGLKGFRIPPRSRTKCIWSPSVLGGSMRVGHARTGQPLLHRAAMVASYIGKSYAGQPWLIMRPESREPRLEARWAKSCPSPLQGLQCLGTSGAPPITARNAVYRTNYLATSKSSSFAGP